MARKFGPVATSIWDSDRFLSLENDTNRLGYLYLIACPHGNSVGVFRLPSVYLAADRRTDHATAEAMLDDMVRVGLIERGDDDQIRIRNWFYQDTGASNPSTGSNFCKVFADTRNIKRGPLRTNAVVEMIFATLSRAEGWNPTTDQYSRMVQDMLKLMQAEAKRDIQAVRNAISQHEKAEPNTVLDTVLDTVSQTVGDIQKQKQETEMDTDTDTERETDTERDTSRGRTREPQKSGKRTTPDDLQAKIKSLGNTK